MYLYMSYVLRYFMSYLKSLVTTYNFLSYFKNDIFDIFFGNYNKISLKKI